MKKLFTFLLALAASTCPLFATVNIDGLEYLLDWDNYTAIFCGCNSGMTDITIPSKVTYKEPMISDQEKKFDVTSIGYQALKGNVSIKTISIPNSVKTIDKYAFSGCSNLTSIGIPSSVGHIGDAAFEGCSSLKSVSLPSGVNEIGSSLFSGCSSLTNVNLPLGITSISTSMFYNCSKLQSVAIPYTVTNIGRGAFMNCSGLKSVIIPLVCTNIEVFAFSGCSSLSFIEIPLNVVSIGDGAFSGCENLEIVRLNSNTLVSKDYTWHFNIRSMFGHQVKEYQLSDGITRVGDAAFYECDNLELVILPSSLVSIGNNAFAANRKLTSMSIPNGVIDIESGAFRGCTNLTSLSMGNSITTIGDGAFSDCDMLPSVFIPNSVTTIGKDAFYMCKSLHYVSIPNGVKEIGEGAFSNTIIDHISFRGTVANWCSKSWVHQLTVPSKTDYALYIDEIKVENLVIPNGAKSITKHAFDHYSSLLSVHISSSVDSIAAQAFYKCTALGSIRCDVTIPPTLGEYVFAYVDHSIPLYVPAESIELYKAALGWKDFFNIQPVAEIPTATDRINENADNRKKILHNGQIYILRGDKTYTLQGQEVK